VELALSARHPFRLLARQRSGRSLGATRQVGPNPSLKRRPTPAGRLARAAPVVHHAPHGQAGPPPRSA
jgi:hypothetical protein